MKDSYSDPIISKPTLAVIKNGLADLCTHTEMGNFFEQYEFEKKRHASFSNKVQRAGIHLDHHDWTDPEIAQSLLDLLENVFSEAISRTGGSRLRPQPRGPPTAAGDAPAAGPD